MLGIISLMIFSIVVVVILSFVDAYNFGGIEPPNPPIQEEADNLITIELTGEVRFPGSIQVEKNSNLDEAILVAGGTTSLADLNAINLFLPLKDKEKIYVPKKSEDAKVSLNTATEEELTTLAGIGPVSAKRIIDYRLTSRFRTINEIVLVSGIGSSTFESNKDRLTL